MELSELTAYAHEKYNIAEQHKWDDVSGFSVLCHPKTGKWLALLMRQWDGERGEMAERCDVKCGTAGLTEANKPYLRPPFRMSGPKWVGIDINGAAEADVVFALFDQAVKEGEPYGYTVVLASELVGPGAYRDTALPAGGAAARGARTSTEQGTERDAAAVVVDGSAAHNTAQPVDTGVYRDTPLPFNGPANRPPQSTLPEQLREMRRLYEYGRESPEARADNFFRQGKFMEAYEDDVPWDNDFICYFPTYHDMTTRQLRGYFAWRTKVRRGEFRPISTSAAYVYIYELLNGIGAATPADSLKQLRAFERGYIDAGYGDGRMRQNLRRWMTELAVVRNVPPEEAREYAAPVLIGNDAALAVLKSPDGRLDEDVFAALCRFGGDKLLQSPAVTTAPGRSVRVFAEVWRRAAAEYRFEGKKLAALCFGKRVTHRWYPLDNAVFCWRDVPENPENYTYELTECTSFSCTRGVWHRHSYEAANFDRDRLRGLLRETELRLRRELKTGRYLREKPGDAWATPFVEAAIEADRRAELEASRPKIEIDLSGLEKIRAEALATRDSLLTGEERAEAEEYGLPRSTAAASGSGTTPPAAAEPGSCTTASAAAEPGSCTTAPTPLPPETVLSALPPTTTPPEPTLSPPPSEPTLSALPGPSQTVPGPTPGTALTAPLSAVQTAILQALLRGEDPEPIIKADRLMPSIAADLLNEALFDLIGDVAVLCEDDRLALVEDYTEDIAHILGGPAYD